MGGIELLLKVRKMEQIQELYFKSRIKGDGNKALTEVEVGYIAV